MMPTNSCLESGIFLIGVIPGSLSLIPVLYIIIKSISQLRSEEAIKISIKSLHYATCLASAMTIIMCSIDAYFLCIPNSANMRILSLLRVSAYFITGYCLLSILLIRLYSSFQDSIFAVTKCQKFKLIVSFSIAALSGAIALTMNAGRNASDWDHMGMEGQILKYLTATQYFCYSFVCIYGTYVFAKKMYQLSQATTNLNRRDSNARRLNKKQMQLLNVASKYISLLILSIGCTWIAFVIVLFLAETGLGIMVMEQLIRMQYSIDCMVNTLCLYLQYPFSEGLYNKYCACFGKMWLCVFKKTLQNGLGGLDGLNDLEKQIENNKRRIKNLNVPGWDIVAANSNEIDETETNRVNRSNTMEIINRNGSDVSSADFMKPRADSLPMGNVTINVGMPIFKPIPVMSDEEKLDSPTPATIYERRNVGKEEMTGFKGNLIYGKRKDEEDDGKGRDMSVESTAPTLERDESTAL